MLEDLRMRGLGDSGDLLLLCFFCLIECVRFRKEVPKKRAISIRREHRKNGEI